MKETKLSRSGKRPLVFIGTEIAKATSKDHNSTRWVNVEVYETKSGKIIVGIAHITCWQGEKDSFYADVFASKTDAVSHIEENASSLAEEISDKLGVAETVQ